MKYVHPLLMDHTKETQSFLKQTKKETKETSVQGPMPRKQGRDSWMLTFLSSANGLDHCSVVRDPFFFLLGTLDKRLGHPISNVMINESHSV